MYCLIAVIIAEHRIKCIDMEKIVKNICCAKSTLFSTLTYGV